VEKLEEKFKEVKDFIRENPHSSLQDVSEAKEVSVKQLKTWVREERLKFADDSPVGIECMNCGAMIKYGKYCEACKGKMINNLSHAVVEEEPVVKVERKSDGNRMRFIDN
jgi:methionyl-tRNA synthetase